MTQQDNSTTEQTPVERALAAIRETKDEYRRLNRWINGQPKPGGPTVFNPSPWALPK